MPGNDDGDLVQISGLVGPHTMDAGKVDLNGCILLRKPWKAVWLACVILFIIEGIVGQSDATGIGRECAVLVEYRVQSAFGNSQYYVASIDIENADPQEVCSCFMLSEQFHHQSILRNSQIMFMP